MVDWNNFYENNTCNCVLKDTNIIQKLLKWFKTLMSFGISIFTCDSTYLNHVY